MQINQVATNYVVLSIGNGSLLTEETRQKLLSLGIDPNTVSSEMEARQKIMKVLEIKKQSHTDNQQSHQRNTTEAQLRKEAEALANQMAVRVSAGDCLSEILQKISDAISKMNDKNPMTAYFKDRFKSLESEYSNLKASTDDYDNMMSIMATSNKIALGLN